MVRWNGVERQQGREEDRVEGRLPLRRVVVECEGMARPAEGGRALLPGAGGAEDRRVGVACGFEESLVCSSVRWEFVDGGSGVEPVDANEQVVRTRWNQSILLIQDSLHMRFPSRAVGPCEPASTCFGPSFREPIPYLSRNVGDLGTRSMNCSGIQLKCDDKNRTDPD